MIPCEIPNADDQLVWDSWLSSMWLPSVLVADEVGLFASLAAAPGSADDLAHRMKLNRRALGAVLPMLASLGYLHCRRGAYHLTHTARHYLLPDSTFYWGAVFTIAREHSPTADRLKHALATMDSDDILPAAVEDRPVDGWASGQIAMEQARAIAQFMHTHSLGAAAGLAQNADFSGVSRLLDVGGGSGCYSIALAQRNPHLRCTIMDLENMCVVAHDYIARGGVNDRVDTRVVDMFRQTWPRGYDAVLFSNVLHDWRPPTCAELVRRAYEALPSGGRILLHEALLNDDGTGPRTTAAFAVLMAVGTQGQQFTFAELYKLLTNAGFIDVECTATSHMYALVQARKP